MKSAVGSTTTILSVTLWLLVTVAPIVVVNASKSFTYADDLTCTYPFESMRITSLTCAKSSFVAIQSDNNRNYYRAQDDNAECFFGDQMDIEGQITASQAVARKYYITLQACFQNGDPAWYMSKKCQSFRTNIDLIDSSMYNSYSQANQQQKEQEQYNYMTYLPAGTYAFSARLLVPKKTFTFKSEYIVSADISLTPGSRSYLVDTYKMKSECTATFNAVYDETETHYQTGYAAAGAAVVFAGLLVGAVWAGTRKRRRLICMTANCLNADDVNAESESDFAAMDNNNKQVELSHNNHNAAADTMSQDGNSIIHPPSGMRGFLFSAVRV